MRIDVSESRIRAPCSASRCESYRTHYACLRIHQDRRAGQSGLPRRPRSAARSGRITRARARSSRQPRRLEAARGILRSQWPVGAADGPARDERRDQKLEELGVEFRAAPLSANRVRHIPHMGDSEFILNTG